MLPDQPVAEQGDACVRSGHRPVLTDGHLAPSLQRLCDLTTCYNQDGESWSQQMVRAVFNHI